jgi:hypothetical protein
MNPDKQIDTLEKKIASLMFQIKSGEILPADSKIGKPFNKLKLLDLASYENLLKEYKKILVEIKTPIDNGQ